MHFEEIKQLDNQYILHTYKRNPVAIDHGQGAKLYDTEGKEYIDFTSGIGVCSLGYGNEAWAKAIYDQALKLGHISNLYYTSPCAVLASRLVPQSGMSGVFFGNSGAEANEGMIKLARKYSFDKYGAGRHTVITLQNSFHGRTITTLRATGQDHFHEFFFPFTEGFRYAPANDLDALLKVAGDDVCAVMMEPIQGEGGVYPLEKEYVQKVAALCQEKDWLLLMDEVQTGMGRTGTLFAFQQFGVTPDVVSFAKGIAGGMPFGGFMAGEKCKDVLSRHPRQHFRRQPHGRSSRQCGDGHPHPGISRPGEGKGRLSEKGHRSHGQPLCHRRAGHGPDAGRRRHRHHPYRAAQQADGKGPAGSDSRQRHPAPAAPAGHHQRRNGSGPCHPETGPG